MHFELSIMQNIYIDYVKAVINKKKKKKKKKICSDWRSVCTAVHKTGLINIETSRLFSLLIFSNWSLQP